MQHSLVLKVLLSFSILAIQKSYILIILTSIADIESYLEEKGFSLTLPQPSIQKSLEDERDELRNIVEMQSKLISRMKDDLLSQTPVLVSCDFIFYYSYFTNKFLYLLIQ